MNTPLHPRYLRASRAFLLVHGPKILKQRRELDAATVRLPDAERPWEGRVEGPDLLRLAVIGDSCATGTGVTSQEDGLPGNLARAIHARTGRGILWRAVGENGIDTEAFLERYLTDAIARPTDIFFISLGANDALHVRSAGAFARDLRRLLATIRDRHPDALVLVANLPIFARFAVLPEPLRTVLYRHSRNLERAAQRVVARDHKVLMPAELPPAYGDGFFAADQFHPSASGYSDWANWAVEEAWSRGLDATINMGLTRQH